LEERLCNQFHHPPDRFGHVSSIGDAPSDVVPQRVSQFGRHVSQLDQRQRAKAVPLREARLSGSQPFLPFTHRARAALRAASLRSAAVRLLAAAVPPDAANFFRSDAESALIRAVPPLLVSSWKKAATAGCRFFRATG